jgi:hypothetical protein
MFPFLGFPPGGQFTDPTIFTKDSYNELIKKKRKEYVHTYFLDVLTPLFEDLRIDATNMKPCRREVTFLLPENFSVSKTESVLCAYFTDLGYKPLVESKKEGGCGEKITITIS